MKIILGTMNIDYVWTSAKSTNTDAYKSIISYYFDWANSNNFIPILDTAYYYANTKTEYTIGKILPELSTKPIIATKANPWALNDFSSGKFGQLDKINLTRQLETSLKNLCLNKVDIFYLHSWDPDTSINETLETATELWRKEKFNKFGISNFSLEQTKQVVELCESNGYCNLSYYQGMYNLVSRKIEEIFPELNSNKIEFWAYNPLAGGLLTGKYLDYANLGDLTKFTNSRFGTNKIYQNIFWKEKILNGVSKLVTLANSRDITNYSLGWYQSDSKISESDGIIIGASTLEQIKLNLEYFTHTTNLDTSIYKKFDIKYKEIETDTPDYYY